MQGRIPKRSKSSGPEHNEEEEEEEVVEIEAHKRRRKRPLPRVNALKSTVQSLQQTASSSHKAGDDGHKGDGFYERARLKTRALVPIQPQMTLGSEDGSGGDKAEGEEYEEEDDDGAVPFYDNEDDENHDHAAVAENDDGDTAFAVQVKEERVQVQAKASDMLEKGTFAWYFDRITNSEVLAQIVAVDKTIDPPGYTILLPDGREKSTERGRLRVVSTKSTTIPAPAPAPVAAVAAVPNLNPVASVVPAALPSIAPPTAAEPQTAASPPTVPASMPAMASIQPIAGMAPLSFGFQNPALGLGTAVAPQSRGIPLSMPGTTPWSMGGMPGFLPGAQIPSTMAGMSPFFSPFPMPMPDFASSMAMANVATASSSSALTTPAATASATAQQIKPEPKPKPAPALFPPGAIPRRWDQPVDPRVKRRQRKESKQCGRVRSAFPLLHDLKLLRYTRLNEAAFHTAAPILDAEPNGDVPVEENATTTAEASTTSAASSNSSSSAPLDGNALLQMIRNQQTEGAAPAQEKDVSQREPIELIGDNFFHLLCGALCVDAQLWADTLKQRLVRLNPTTCTLPGETECTSKPAAAAATTTPSDLLECIEQNKLHALPDQLLLQCWPYELMHVKVTVFDFGAVAPEQLQADETGVILQMPDSLEIRSYESDDSVRGSSDRGRMIYLWVVKANNRYFQLTGPTTGDAMFQSLLRDVGRWEGAVKLVQYFHHKLNFVLFPDGTTACRRWELERGSIPRLLGTREERMMAQLQANNARLRAVTTGDDERSQTFTSTPPTALRTAFCTEYLAAAPTAEDAGKADRGEAVDLSFARAWLHSGFGALSYLPGTASAHAPAAIHQGQTLYLLPSEELAADSTAAQQQATAVSSSDASTVEVIGDFAEVRRWYAARDAQRKVDYKERHGYPHDYELVLNKLVPDLAAPACATMEKVDPGIVNGRNKGGFVDPDELDRRLKLIRAVAAGAGK